MRRCNPEQYGTLFLSTHYLPAVCAGAWPIWTGMGGWISTSSPLPASSSISSWREWSCPKPSRRRFDLYITFCFIFSLLISCICWPENSEIVGQNGDTGMFEIIWLSRMSSSLADPNSIYLYLGATFLLGIVPTFEKWIVFLKISKTIKYRYLVSIEKTS